MLEKVYMAKAKKLQEAKNQAVAEIDNLQALNPGQVLAEKH